MYNVQYMYIYMYMYTCKYIYMYALNPSRCACALYMMRDNNTSNPNAFHGMEFVVQRDSVLNK